MKALVFVCKFACLSFRLARIRKEWHKAKIAYHKEILQSGFITSDKANKTGVYLGDLGFEARAVEADMIELLGDHVTELTNDKPTSDTTKTAVKA